MANATYETMDIGPYAQYFGNKIAQNFDMMVHGEPGAGKTYFLLKFAHWLAQNKGDVLFVSNEEFGAVTLTDKINQTGATSPNLYFTKKLDGVNLSKYAFVFLDSINSLGITLKQYIALREKNPNLGIVLLVQKTKAGAFKGGKDWEHEVEIAAELTTDADIGGNSRFINVYKNRYGLLTTKEI